MKRREVQAELIDKIKKNNYEKPDFIVEDLETIDFKEKNKSLIIDYSYQRNFIQNQTSASKYVESVFLGLIIPEIQVYENKEQGYREIIDGQQRVLSLLKFLRNEYRLRGLTYLKVLNGKKFKDLPEELQTIYRQFCINMRVAKNPTQDYKYLLFERLNIGSKPLNQQEIRNCVFKDHLILRMTRKISNNDSIVELIENVGRIRNERFLRDEFIVGVIAARFTDLSMTHTLLKDRINYYLRRTDNISKEETEQIFTELFDIVELLNSKYDLDSLLAEFLVRKSILETIILAMWEINDIEKLSENVDALKIAILDVVSSDEFKETLETGSSQANKLVYKRVQLMLTEMKKIIG